MTKEEDELLLKARGGRAAMISQQVNADKPVSGSADESEPPDPFANKDETLAQDLQAQLPDEPAVSQVLIEVGTFPNGAVAVKMTSGPTALVAMLGVEQARALAAQLAQISDTLMPHQATIFVVTEKMSWTLPNQAISFRFDTAKGHWQSAWHVPHKVVPNQNGKNELKRSTALILPPGMRN